MGQRSRKRSRASVAPGAGTPEPSPPPARPADRYARSRARDDEIRASLEPLGAGERPPAIVIAAVLAALLGLSNLALFVAGVTVAGKKPSLVGILAFTALMVSAAVGLWRLRYWAVLGFQALLAIVLLTFSLLLLRASSVQAALLCVAVCGLGGVLFWKLIRAMARVQMPKRHVP